MTIRSRLWYVFLLFFIVSAAWIYVYKKLQITPKKETHKIKYFVTSIIVEGYMTQKTKDIMVILAQLLVLGWLA